MSKRNSIISKEQPTTLRRSPRLQHQENPQESEYYKTPKPKPTSNRVRPSSISNPETPNSDTLLSSAPNASLKKAHKDYPEKVTKKSNKSNDGSKNCAKFSTGSRKSPRLNNGVEGFSCLRRSSRLSYRENTDKHVEKASEDKSKVGVGSCERFVARRERRLRSSSVGFAAVVAEVGEKKEVGVDSCEQLVVKRERTLRSSSVGSAAVVAEGGERKKVGIDSSEQFVVKSQRKLRSSSVGSAAIVVEGGERKVSDVDKGNKEIGVKRKRNRGEEGDEHVQGWTKEQEVALQRAYFAAKPTPHFWKKVAKLVPGKSAQDCFDRVHSDSLTPPQPRPRSRANRRNLSSAGYFSLSASQLLKPTGPKIKRPSCNKQKSRLAQKTVRHLLQKHYNGDKDYEADLFSVLEPTMNPCTKAFPQSVILSTPEHVPEKRGLLQKCCERSSSGRKKPLSRFISSCGTALVSPLVLKQVNNRALHEKYIDQLHCREAKRKAASVQAAKSVRGSGDRKECHVQKLDVLRTAKNALVSEARDVIDQFRDLQANPTSNYSDFDDSGVDIDDEVEDGP